MTCDIDLLLLQCRLFVCARAFANYAGLQQPRDPMRTSVTGARFEGAQFRPRPHSDDVEEELLPSSYGRNAQVYLPLRRGCSCVLFCERLYLLTRCRVFL